MMNLNRGIDWLIERLRKDQSPNGAWNYPFATGLMTDIYDSFS